MARLSVADIQDRVADLARRPTYSREFIFDLLVALGRSRASVTRLRSGNLNIADNPEVEVAQKGVVYFKPTDADLHLTIAELDSSPTVTKYDTRFLIATDYENLVALDRASGETLNIAIDEVDEHFEFFLPWAGMEKAQYVAEAHADIKAAERLGKLFDELAKENSPEDISRHSLNLFFTRLLFCFFAEDTGIFTKGLFTEKVESLTQDDGSDLQSFLTQVFDALDTEDPSAKPALVRAFPYVNGQLFARGAEVVPRFSRQARNLLLRSGHLRWDEINPDIFGSMFQAVVDPQLRGDLGQHYTSVPNILKTIDPLFMEGLWEEFEAAQGKPVRLNRLLDRIGGIKVFDPACGSGNFLVIAYKELRRLENEILKSLGGQNLQSELFGSRIKITNFYGIEIDPLAREVAVLSLWIAKHQMNQEFNEIFGIDIPLIPLKDAGQIVTGNAARIDWNQVCPNDGETEIYLVGNPPYVGSSMQTNAQKCDFEAYFGTDKYPRNLDYISLWFFIGAEYIAGTAAALAFVSTNSVVQGDHVGIFMPRVLSSGIEIGFAHTSFRWSNSARANAGVTVVVISLRNPSPRQKVLITDGHRRTVGNISPYLTEGASVVVERGRNPRHGMPPMTRGSQPTDGGGLIFSSAERTGAVAEDPSVERWIKRYMGASELISDKERYCLWIRVEEVEEAARSTPVKKRLERVRRFRENGKSAISREFAARPWRFLQAAHKDTEAIIVPSVSSERREYVPIGYLGPDTVISNLAFAIYDAEPWVFALVTSRMHMAWLRAVGGKLKTDFRYSNTLVYNTFPVPDLTAAQKETLTQRALRVLDVREYHSEKTLAELYDPDLMPGNLRLAHKELDDAVDALYRKSGFASDEDRLALLFDLYVQKTSAKESA